MQKNTPNHNEKQFNPSYIGLRNDVVSLVPPSTKNVLDIGCSVGAIGLNIKRNLPTANVFGVEISPEMARVAKENLDEVIVGDIQKLDLNNAFTCNSFDCIIFADVLEHLENPWAVLKETANYLTDDGVILISIPNIRHISSLVNLIGRGYWPYNERGLYDKTHLRFFTLKNIKELCKQSGLTITKLRRNYRVSESPQGVNKYSKWLALPLIKEFFVIQYLVVAKKQTA